MLWVNHAPGLRATGASGAEFYREVWCELSQFIHSLRRESEVEAKNVLPSANICAKEIGTRTAAMSI
jgi:hypothetical protein